MDDTRVDQWLWAVRVYKTRTASTDACKGGHVDVNGTSGKAATPVRPGDRVEARFANGVVRILEVVQPIDKRVGPPTAVTCFVDHSPPPPERDAVAPLFRERGAGRPTKRDRRELDRLRRPR